MDKDEYCTRNNPQNPTNGRQTSDEGENIHLERNPTKNYLERCGARTWSGYRHRPTQTTGFASGKQMFIENKVQVDEDFVVPTLLLDIPSGSCQFLPAVGRRQSHTSGSKYLEDPSNQRIRQSLI